MTSLWQGYDSDCDENMILIMTRIWQGYEYDGEMAMIWNSLVVVKLAEYISVPGRKNDVNLEDDEDDDDANLDRNVDEEDEELHLIKQDVWLSKSAWQMEHLKAVRLFFWNQVELWKFK